MRCWWQSAAMAVSAAVLFSSTAPARAVLIARPTGPGRVVQADGIVLGRVVAHEPKDLQLSPAPGADNKLTYRVAVINVGEAIKGDQNAKTVRVAFIPPPDDTNPNPKPNPRPILGRPGGPRGTPQLFQGADGMFFLTRHHSEKDLYVVQNVFDVVQRNNPDFDKELKEAKRIVKLAENAVANLQADNAQDRVDAAAILIAKYRDPRFAGGKTVAIPAEESKLILKALLDGNWDRSGRLTGQGSWDLFMQLGVSDKDGWKFPPKANLEQLHDAAKDWLKKHADRYQIQRFMPGNQNDNKTGNVRPGVDQPGVQPGLTRRELAGETRRK
ncbi:MAG: hypothetical protein HY040_21720 [Planctomycetes bacterium]|nr:hypothetical protein [Planctomycetota bacterium]